jgi:2Fe-2S ferredoxin
VARITYIEFDGTEHVTEVAPGLSVMAGARNADIPGIDADCGGNCSCATCHVFVDPAWTARVGGQGELEAATIDFAENLAPNSRLSCQIKVTQDLDGLVVRMPQSQR